MTRAHEEIPIYHSIPPPATMPAGDTVTRSSQPGEQEWPNEPESATPPSAHAEPLVGRRWRLLDYTPGMLANHAAAWWQARKLTKDKNMREAWTERLGGWENMSRTQKAATIALDVGAVALAMTALNRIGPVADINIPDIIPWFGDSSADGSANALAQPESDPPPLPNPAETNTSIRSPANPENLISTDDTLDPAINTVTDNQDYYAVVQNGDSPESVLDDSWEENGTLESDNIDNFTGKINPDTGYLFGTAYNTIAETLIAHGVNPKQDIPAHEYHNMVGQVLAHNDWTWESARCSMQPTDTLTINREIFADYLPLPAPEPPPQPPPAEPPPAPEEPPAAPENHTLPTTGLTWWHLAALGVASLAGGAIGYVLGRQHHEPLHRRRYAFGKLRRGEKPPALGTTQPPIRPTYIHKPEQTTKGTPPTAGFNPRMTVPPPEPPKKTEGTRPPGQPLPPEPPSKQLTLNPVLGIKPKRLTLNPVLGIKPPKRRLTLNPTLGIKAPAQPKEKEIRQITSYPTVLLPPQKPPPSHRGTTPLAFNPAIELPHHQAPREAPAPEVSQETAKAAEKKPEAKEAPKRKRAGKKGRKKAARAAAVKTPVIRINQKITLPPAERPEGAKDDDEKPKKPNQNKSPEQPSGKKNKKQKNKQRSRKNKKKKTARTSDAGPSEPTSSTAPPPPEPPHTDKDDGILAMLSAGLNISIQWRRDHNDQSS